MWAFFSLFFFHYSENYLVKWSSSGLVKDIDQLHNLRAVFTVGVFGTVEFSVCVCVFGWCWWLFIQPCYEAFGSLFADGPCLLSSFSKILTWCLYLPRLSPRYNGGSRVSRVIVDPLGQKIICSMEFLITSMNQIWICWKWFRRDLGVTHQLSLSPPLFRTWAVKI